jgi:3-deoxy-D-manno-octulosonic-acid transferase
MRLWTILLAYNLLLPFVLVVLLPASLVKMRRRGGYGAKFWQRFGFFDAATRARLESGRGRAWWLHAVSVGEVNVARKLIAERLKAAPGDPVVLSVTTSTGYAVAVKDAPEALTVIYSPVDLLPVPGRLLEMIRPVVLVLVEAEVWPNLVWGARKRGIPVVLANARLSPRSERRYGKVRALVEPVFGLLTRVLVQDASDAARWASIGVPEERIVLSGSVKYDLAGAVREERVPEFRGILERVWGPGHPVILAASTHGGEEAALVEALRPVLEAIPEVRLAVAPRHAERRGEVVAAVEATGGRAVLRTRVEEEVEEGGMPPVLVIDSTGELRDWQALATVVVMGKSFLSRGGQNPAEAIAAGVPVICGPHMENFTPLIQLLLGAGGITQVEGMEVLAGAVMEVMRAPEEARAVAERGRRALEQHRGATRRSVVAIGEVVGV